jgi:poly-gamma-glutamate capsule biosynthesis protein CapA/YwtB (metallophosphatase superfamily)
MHWGNELENESNKNQKRCAHSLVDAGADLVIGTHAHITQEIEYYNDVPIVYSLGNFIYGGQSRDMYMLEATFDYSSESTGTVRLRVYPGISGYKSTRKYEKESETSVKLKNLDKKSDTCSIDDDGFVIYD